MPKPVRPELPDKKFNSSEYRESKRGESDDIKYGNYSRVSILA